MLNQNDLVRLLSVEPPPEQHIVFSILHAYVFSKSRRGNLPSETMSKLLSVQRKLLLKRGGKAFEYSSPIARAFEAMRIQMLAVNKAWMVKGVAAFGPLGAIGATGNSPLAIEAWRKATDNKVKQFPSGQGDGAMGWGVPLGAIEELDAGRVIGPGFIDSADPRTMSEMREAGIEGDDLEGLPPGYEPPTPSQRSRASSRNGTRRTTGEAATTGTTARRTEGEDSVQQDPAVVEALNGRMEGTLHRPTSLTASESGRTDSGENSPPLAPLTPVPEAAPRDSIEAGVSHLARLRALKEEQERLAALSNGSNGAVSATNGQASNV